VRSRKSEGKRETVTARARGSLGGRGRERERERERERVYTLSHTRLEYRKGLYSKSVYICTCQGKSHLTCNVNSPLDSQMSAMICLFHSFRIAMSMI